MAPLVKKANQPSKRKAANAESFRPAKASKLQHVESAEVEEVQTKRDTKEQDSNCHSEATGPLIEANSITVQEVDRSRSGATESLVDAKTVTTQQDGLDIDTSKNSNAEVKIDHQNIATSKDQIANAENQASEIDTSKKQGDRQETSQSVVVTSDVPSEPDAIASQHAISIASSSQSNTPARKDTGITFPDFENDRSKNMFQYWQLQNRVSELTPKTHLPRHRYWIAVIEKDKNVTAANADRNVTWFKGNRKITVKTILRVYEIATCSEGAVILLGTDKVSLKDTMEELYFNKQNLIVFRSFIRRQAHLISKRLTDGLVPPVNQKPALQPIEIIELD